MGDNADVALIPINWSVERFERLKASYGIPNDLEPEYPSSGGTAAKPPPGKITLYADFFSEANFRVPITSFVIDLLQFYKIHLSQVHPLGMYRIRHFEFCCIALKQDPSVAIFHHFYKLYLKDSWFSFSKRPGVIPHAKETPQGFRGWKEKFFYITARMVPASMQIRSLRLAVVDIPPNLDAFKKTHVFSLLTSRPADIQEIPEHALVGVGMSRNWGRLDRVPIYSVGKEPVASYYDVLFPDSFKNLTRTYLSVGPGERNVLEVFHERFFFPRASLQEAEEVLVTESQEDEPEEVLVRKKASGSASGEKVLSPQKKRRKLTEAYAAGKKAPGASPEGLKTGEGVTPTCPVMQTAKTAVKNPEGPNLQPSVPKVKPSPVPKSMPTGTQIPPRDKGKEKEKTPTGTGEVHSPRSSCVHTSQSDFRMPTQSEPWTPANSKSKHVPNWNILQGDCLTDPHLCRTFLLQAFPPAERLRHSTCSPEVLSDRAALSWVESMAVMPEICRKWDEGCREVAHLRKALAQKNEDAGKVLTLTQEVKKLDWQLKERDAAHSKARVEFTEACSRTNKELEKHAQMIREAKAHSEELAFQVAEKDEELRVSKGRLDMLEGKVVSFEKEREGFEVEKAKMVKELSLLKEDRKWLVAEGFSRVVEAVRGSDEFIDGVVGLNGAAEAAGYHDGLSDGFQAGKTGFSLESLPGRSSDARTILTQRQDAFDTMEFPVVGTLASLADQSDLREIRDVLTIED
ncbi:hypothetical protein L1987_36431 [Smallanthus sonchifolius]|uniref:Uncharacterized protein n=1 Tax=Smallanthus sonchifolius TaxID=185202 RepID=A0ACB9HD63_9ASTR|nr:hypothetical protein L1987_36431 [Smallanthus sonchifolius]